MWISKSQFFAFIKQDTKFSELRPVSRFSVIFSRPSTCVEIIIKPLLIRTEKFLELDSFVNELDFYEMSGILVQKQAVKPIDRIIFKSILICCQVEVYVIFKLNQVNGNFIFKILSRNQIHHFLHMLFIYAGKNCLYWLSTSMIGYRCRPIRSKHQVNII